MNISKLQWIGSDWTQFENSLIGVDMKVWNLIANEM